MGKVFENGCGDGDTAVGYSVWERPQRQSTAYALTPLGMESRRLQDVGLNGLSTEEELVFPRRVSGGAARMFAGRNASRMEEDPHSPLKIQRGDTLGITGRGAGSTTAKHPGTIQDITTPKAIHCREDNPYSSTAEPPDTEDIDGDNTMNVNEAYYQYRASLRPESMRVGTNYITDKRGERAVKGWQRCIGHVVPV